MKSFFANLKKYMPYTKATAVAELKSEVADSHLGWLWWILDPLLFMCVYSFIVIYAFGRSDIPHLPLYCFIGLVGWNLFAKTINSSVKIIQTYKGLLMKVYIPKYMLIAVKLMVNLIKMFIGIALAFALIVILRIDMSFDLLHVIPILIVYITLTFGVALYFAHFGVYVTDLNNVTQILIRLLFYMSAIFYTTDRFPPLLQSVYSYVCPTGELLAQMRNVMIMGGTADYLMLGYWFAIGIILIIGGISLMNKYENNYIKVV